MLVQCGEMFRLYLHKYGYVPRPLKQQRSFLLFLTVCPYGRKFFLHLQTDHA